MRKPKEEHYIHNIVIEDPLIHGNYYFYKRMRRHHTTGVVTAASPQIDVSTSVRLLLRRKGWCESVIGGGGKG